MYDIIKKLKGEAFAQGIRNYDARIFDVPDIQEWVRYARRDVEPLLPFLRSLISKSKTQEISDKSPFELLKQAGYTAFYVDTLKKQNSIKKYFSKKEELCTFSDPNRFKRYHIIHCVKEGADKLKRSDFKGHEDRQDEYGTSVISIQILKTGGFISIKNRYNSQVLDCDNTFDSNPDNIIKGLSASLEKHFKLQLQAPKVPSPCGYTYQRGCIYRYNYERDNVYIGDGFYVKDGNISKIYKDYQFPIGSYLFDLKEKTVKSLGYENDPYVQIMNEEMADKKIQKRVVDGSIHLYLDGELFFKTKKKSDIDYFDIDCVDYIDEITLSKARELPDGDVCGKLFKKVSVMRAPEVRKIGSNCLCNVDFFDLPKLEETGNHCFSYRYMDGMDKIYLPHLRKIGNECFARIAPVSKIILPELREAGDETFIGISSCSTLLLPKLERIGSKSIAANANLTKIIAPCLKSMGSYCINGNDMLESLCLLQLEDMGANCFSRNKNLRKVVLPHLQRADKESFRGNKAYCYCGNKAYCYIKAPNLPKSEDRILHNSQRLKTPELGSYAPSRKRLKTPKLEGCTPTRKRLKTPKFESYVLSRVKLLSASAYKKERAAG